MGHIIAFAGQKGGSGKTTMSVSAAVEWQRQGHRVLLVDADPQGSLLTWSHIASQQGEDPPKVVRMGANLHRKNQLPALARSYDIVVVDCPGRLGDIQESVNRLADLVVLPCGPGAIEAWSLSDSIGLVLAAQRTINPRLKAGILITRKLPKTMVARTARVALKSCGVALFNSEVTTRVAFIEAPAAGQGVTTYQPRGAAAREVKAFVCEMDKWLGGEEVRHVA